MIKRSSFYTWSILILLQCTAPACYVLHGLECTDRIPINELFNLLVNTITGIIRNNRNCPVHGFLELTVKQWACIW